jgi:D-alanine-D-alanine ligase
MNTIGLFCGGYSSEYDISMKSAKLIQNHFPEEYQLVKIVITEKEWYCEDSNGKQEFDMDTGMADLKSGKKKIDLAIVCIHGDPGENGKIQAYLEMKGILCINSDFQASSLAFDKFICNQFLNSQNIETAQSLLLRKNQSFNPQEICSKLGLPLFVKPTDSGSSYGISKVYEETKLKEAIDFAFNEGSQVILESFLDGRELTCAAFRIGNKIKTLPITEIISENDFFDYDAKYNGKSREETPAKIDEELTNDIKKTTCKIYELLNLKSVARIDYILVNRRPAVIEVNTIPGFSEASIVPQMLKLEGIAIKDFWRQLIYQELNKQP